MRHLRKRNLLVFHTLWLTPHPTLTERPQPQPRPSQIPTATKLDPNRDRVRDRVRHRESDPRRQTSTKAWGVASHPFRKYTLTTGGAASHTEELH